MLHNGAISPNNKIIIKMYFNALRCRSTAGESVGRVRKIREKKEKKQDDILEDDDEDDKMWQTVNRQKTGGQVMGGNYNTV